MKENEITQTPLPGYLCAHCFGPLHWHTGHNPAAPLAPHGKHGRLRQQLHHHGHVRELRCEKCGLINGHFLKVQDYRRHVKEGTFDAIKEDRKAKLIAAALRQGKIVEVIGE